MGWKTNRKIIVFESDDWGSIRMPSKQVYNLCLRQGYPVDKNPFERYDSIASDSDLNILFNLLHEFKDVYGNHPLITANVCVANPDFEKIEADNYANYHYEIITHTFKQYPAHNRVWEYWMAGMNSSVFYPQFHAREHLNVPLFMEKLQENDSDLKFGFNNRICGIIEKVSANPSNAFVEASFFRTLDEKNVILNAFTDGLNIFEGLFGFKSLSFIPTNYIWSSDFNKPFAEHGVRYIQGRRRMLEPDLKGGKMIKNTFSGHKNQFNQISLIRNCQFEPAIYKNSDEVDNCLKEISIAFQCNNPAIISTHRLNFVGFIDESNRERNIKLFRKLLSSILKKWPDVEFMTSSKLGSLIESVSNLKNVCNNKSSL